ncbi:hypothetical protein [Candidatus Mycoplasma mahonii]|uniref:hypothetical protein n=1 Tax=Candidatus Mycoplasma mahonii TaxID=3004105 RepID=UPI0026EA1E59|nr:hypothetical protein [Candidatus Mycoplasma mahonii]WKX02205.1 hypothetical protein O3I44_02260 [Candidatus Mycoplasma mahonii]
MKLDIKKILKHYNVNITENRISILNCLNDDFHFHSITDIKNHSQLNTKSIYNNIKVLSDAGLIDSYSSGGIVKYALTDSIIGHKNDIHIVEPGNKISHININEKIFQAIKKEVTETGKTVASVKIFVNVK